MQRSSEEIAKDVTEELKWDPGLDDSNIDVAVKNSVVTLTGHVGSHVDKYEAEQAAKRISGVLAVINEIEVRLPAAEQKRSPPAEPTDRIRVTVKDGWVTLDGTAESHDQRQSAENAVRRIKGVKGISNLIQVISPAQPDPEQVKRKIEDALRRSAEIRANRIQVETSNGTVVLKGTVRSWIEREEAERAAWSAPGVDDVEDRIVVSP